MILMKKLLTLLAVLLLCACAACAEPIDERLLAFDESDYKELSMSEIPEGELTEELLRRLTDEQAARLLDSILPRLTEKGYVQDIPRAGYLDYEGALWRVADTSFWDLYDLVDTTPQEELPHEVIHLNTDCDPAATNLCNYFAIYFFELENYFVFCPDCFPVEWTYYFLVSSGIEGTNQLEIVPFDETVPASLAQPMGVMVYFDHETDECLSIAVEFNQQGFVIVWQAEDFAIDGVLGHCKSCDRHHEYAYEWDVFKPGIWHCRNCGELSMQTLSE